MSNQHQFGPQPWNHPGNSLSINGPDDYYYPRGPHETFAGNYALKEFHSNNTFVPYKSPNPICDWFSNVDNSNGSRQNSMLSYSTSGSWKPK